MVGEGGVVVAVGGRAAGGQATEASQRVEGRKSLVLTDGAGHAVETWVLGETGTREEGKRWGCGRREKRGKIEDERERLEDVGKGTYDLMEEGKEEKGKKM